MKKLTRKELSKRLDRLRQTCARYDGAVKSGGVWTNRCVTCGKTLPCSKLHGGHFIPRGCHPLRWDDRNVNPQCAGCNTFKNGAYIEYSQWFIKRFGQETFDEYVETYTRWKQGKIYPFHIVELEDLYNKWLRAGRELEQKIGPTFPKSWHLELDFIE